MQIRTSEAQFIGAERSLSNDQGIVTANQCDDDMMRRKQDGSGRSGEEVVSGS